MINARVIFIDNLNTAIDEIRKIGADAASIQWMAPKSVHIVIKLENMTSYAANILKQEMLGKGGEAAVNRGVINCSIERSDVLLMGTYAQYERLVHKLDMQSGILKEASAEIRKVMDGAARARLGQFECGKFKFALGDKTYLMGILNVTPDSFSDGGLYHGRETAIRRAGKMIAEGADIIDIGGESTRPGYEPVEPSEEADRVVPVIECIVKEYDIPVSIDTSKAYVAEKALEAGACIVNDVWGLQKDPLMAGAISRCGAGVILMHNQQDKDYRDLMGNITGFLRKSVKIAEESGIGRKSIIVDPGIGFAKKLEHNLEVIRRLKELNTLGLPILLGTSRKSMIGNILDLPVSDRVEGTAATVTLGIAAGVDIIRVHDIKEMARVAKMTDAIVRSWRLEV
jgi:dihydropteroate synthase